LTRLRHAIRHWRLIRAGAPRPARPRPRLEALGGPRGRPRQQAVRVNPPPSGHQPPGLDLDLPAIPVASGSGPYCPATKPHVVPGTHRPPP